MCAGDQLMYSCGCAGEYIPCSGSGLNCRNGHGLWAHMIMMSRKCAACINAASHVGYEEQQYKASILAKVQTPRDRQGLQKDVPDYSVMQGREVDDDEASLIYTVPSSFAPSDASKHEAVDDGASIIYSVFSFAAQSDTGKHEGIKSEGKSSCDTFKQRVAMPLYETAPHIESDTSKKKQAAARLLKSSIQHALLKMQHLRKANHGPITADTQVHGDNGDELKKVQDELLQAVDDCFMLV